MQAGPVHFILETMPRDHPVRGSSPPDAAHAERMPNAPRRMAGLRALGPEPFAVEAISKVLALLVPEAVPLMPPPARAFVLGQGATQDGV